MLERPAAKAAFAAGSRLRRPNSQNSNYARRFSQGFSYPYSIRYVMISYHTMWGVGVGTCLFPVMRSVQEFWIKIKIEILENYSVHHTNTVSVAYDTVYIGC